MTTQLSNDFSGLAAARIRAAHSEIASRWLAQLQALLPLGANEIFPSADVLDHIPALIREIADYIGSGDAVAANTAIQSKAHELGELRFEQKASVHQLLREYRVLGSVVATFLGEQLDADESLARPGEAIAVLSRLNDAVFVLLQMTVDTFVNRYTERIEEQTIRLEGFNRMVSHELRQPLTTLQYAVELLADDGGVDSATRDRLTELTRRNVRRLGDLVRMLGALAVPDRDNPQVQVVDVAKIVDDVFRQVTEAAEARGVATRHAIAAAEITIDLARVELVLINLVSNGIKYRDPAKADPFVEVSFVGGEDSVEFRVRDNGLGIAEADRPHIFQRFVRAHAARDGELGNDGLGLGLAIAAECVKAMRGSIAVESTVGDGTTFVLTLPATPGAA
ncbi:MAG TPA: HAMP domain-containing sensor histidine kinase [Vicinamibacterales bacterium]|nr:HAMP domain-containing sensor histidine kinase [Vicinamibacterales bacterium]